MELTIENNLEKDLNNEQNKFLDTTLGKAINNGINVGIRYILPDYLEDKIIDVKDNLIKYGLKEGISKSIKTAIDIGKSSVGIITGNFENINQINEAVKSGGIIDNISDLLDDVFNKIEDKGKINNSVTKLLKNGKDSILKNIEKNIESTLTSQITNSVNIENYIKNWKTYYSNKNFSGMEKEYQKIEETLKTLVPIETTISEARNIEILHNYIKNNNQDFEITEEETELIKKLK